jgi:phosphoribosyl 1,2-cyclic phosphodiesterase
MVRTPLTVRNGLLNPYEIAAGQPIERVWRRPRYHDTDAVTFTLSALFIEASFPASEKERAQERGHLTTAAAGHMAKAAGARRVEPFHFSPRNHLTENVMLAEVARAFSGRTDPAK